MQIIYNTLYGSRAYGINNLNSDFDFRMVYVPTKKDKLLISNPDLIHTDKYQLDIPYSQDDVVIKLINIDLTEDKEQLKTESNVLTFDYKQYELNRFKEGLYSGNVECIEMLFCSDIGINHIDNIFTPLLEARNEFIAKRVVERYLSTSLSAIKEINKIFKELEKELPNGVGLNRAILIKHLKNMFRCYISAIDIIKNNTLSIGVHKDFILQNVDKLVNVAVEDHNVIYDVLLEIDKYLEMINFTTESLKYSNLKEEVNRGKIDDIILSIYESCGI